MRRWPAAYFALFDGLVTPATAGFLRSIEFVAMAVLGGLGSIFGSIVGAAILVMLPQVLTVFHDYEHIALGADHDRVHDFPAGRHRACGLQPVPRTAAGMSILVVEDLGIDFGGVIAVDGVSFAVEQAEIFAIIGPNGAGKTTLFNMMSGLYTPLRGRMLLADEDVTNLPAHELARRGLSRTFQNLQIFFRMTAIENVMVGRHLHENRNVLAHLFTLPSVIDRTRPRGPSAAELLALVGLR